MGKTSLMCCIANSRMTGAYAQETISIHKRETRLINKQLGRDLTAATDHLVFSDFDFYAVREYARPVKSWDIDGWWIGLPNPYIKTAYLPAYSTIMLVEAEKYYDSRRTQTYPLPPWVYRFYERHRHKHYDIFFDCHRPIQIDKGIRTLAESFIYPIHKKDDSDKYGCLIRSTWDCIEFSGLRAAEEYCDTKKITEDAQHIRYIHYGNIHACYNSFGFAESFDNVPQTADYTFTKNRKANVISSHGAPYKPDYDTPAVFMQKKWDKYSLELEEKVIKNWELQA